MGFKCRIINSKIKPSAFPNNTFHFKKELELIIGSELRRLHQTYYITSSYTREICLIRNYSIENEQLT